MRRLTLFLLMTLLFLHAGCTKRLVVPLPLYIKLSPTCEEVSFYKEEVLNKEKAISFLEELRKKGCSRNLEVVIRLYCFIKDESAWKETSLFLEKLAGMEFVEVIVVSVEWPPKYDNMPPPNPAAFIWEKKRGFPIDGAMAEGIAYRKPAGPIAYTKMMSYADFLAFQKRL